MGLRTVSCLWELTVSSISLPMGTEMVLHVYYLYPDFDVLGVSVTAGLPIVTKQSTVHTGYSAIG